MAELSVPTIDFSALGQLPQIYKQGQADNLRQQTLASLGQGGTADAAALLKSGDLSLAQLGISLQNHQDTLRQQEIANARQAAQDKQAQSNADRSYGLQVRTANRADDKTPAGFSADPNQPGGYIPIPGGPADPAYLSRRAEVEAANKPIPVETIGGTKFLTRNKDGGYSMIDPSTMGQPAATAPAGQQPAQQPGQPTPPQSQPAVSADEINPETGRRDGYLQSLDPQVRDYIKKVADYEIDPRTTSVKGGMREKLMAAVAKYDPSYNQNEFGARSKATKDFSTGAQGNSIRSFDVAIDHLDLLGRAAKAMDNGDLRILNEVRNKWREQTGSELPTNFNALKPLVSGEVAKAAIGSNNALADREELRGPLNAAGSGSQIAGVISSYKGLMAGQVKGLKKQYEDTTGKKDFDSRLREATKRELGIGAASQGASAADPLGIR